MKLNRNTLSAIKLFQLHGGTIDVPQSLGISNETLQTLTNAEIIAPNPYQGYSLCPLPSFLRPPPYHTLETLLPYDSTSFFNKDCVIGLGNLLRENAVETVVELGSWKGISTIFLATFLPLHGKVYAIDHWKGSAEHTEDCSQLYHQFLSNVIHTRLTDQIIPLKMTTLEASKQTYPPIDLLFVDASHDERSVLEDLEAWYPHIRLSGGSLCGDDYLWGKERGYPVQRALKRFTQKHSLSYKTQGTFWVMD